MSHACYIVNPHMYKAEYLSVMLEWKFCHPVFSSNNPTGCLHMYMYLPSSLIPMLRGLGTRLPVFMYIMYSIVSYLQTRLYG